MSLTMVRGSMLRRDLKPENFLLADQSDRSELKATDFGLSAFFRPGQVFSEILGSAYYIAPEARRRPCLLTLVLGCAGQICRTVLLTQCQDRMFFLKERCPARPKKHCIMVLMGPT